MAPLFISLGFGLLAFAVALLAGVRCAFRWTYLPMLFCVPESIHAVINGIPDLSPQRAALYGLVVGAALRGEAWRLVPKWRGFDTFVLVIILSFSTSYGLETDPKGFLHRLIRLTLDWGGPYLLTRACLPDWEELRKALVPLSIGMSLCALATIAECRLATRVSTTFWNSLGADLRVVPHYWGFRWGYLRAAGIYDHPIMAGSIFASLALLLLSLGWLNPVHRPMAIVASGLCALACIASISRGPMLALACVLLGFGLLRIRMRGILGVLLVMGVCVFPFAMERLSQEWQATQQLVDETGNTAAESGRYRLAILMIYGDKIMEAGFFGGLASLELDEHLQDAWSVDNSYVFLLLMGGWIGGGLFIIFVIAVFAKGVATLRAARGGAYRIPRELVFLSFCAIIFSLTNVFFATNLGYVFWVSAALVLNSPVAATPRIRSTVRNTGRGPFLPIQTPGRGRRTP
ncbi:MAG: O-antigen ligase family protein [Phycisphaerae bacterium]|nr:O-antigen ligase family protein [Phycisphaerae bacterium]